MKFGYLHQEQNPEDYVFGAGQIQGDVLQPDGQWDAYLPPPDIQDRNGYETYACASEGTKHAIQMLLRRLYRDIDEYSVRFIASISGTEQQQGNSPHTVAEYWRKVGNCLESEYPFSAATYEAFYADIPQAIIDKAGVFVRHFALKHDYVPTDASSLKDALRYSPLGISVYAWVQDGDLFIKPEGVRDNHFVTLYGYVEGQYWLIFDSYDTTVKKLAWDYKFETAKRYHVELQAEAQQELSLLQRILQTISAWLAALKPSQPQNPAIPATPPAEPPQTTAPQPQSKPSVADFCACIKDYEGWGGPGTTLNGVSYPEGTPSYRRNNPGNVRCSNEGYASMYGTVGCEGGFAVFKDYATGWLYLNNLVIHRIQANPSWTLLQFMQVYAPSSDDNDPQAYAAYIAKRLGVETSLELINLLS